MWFAKCVFSPLFYGIFAKFIAKPLRISRKSRKFAVQKYKKQITTLKKLKIMTLYNVYDNTTGERKTCYTITEAKKWIRERIKQGHDAGGSKTKVYSNGDWVNAGEINLKGSNKAFIANTRMTKANY